MRLEAAAEGGPMTNHNSSTGTTAEPRILLSLLYSVMEEAKKYEDCLKGIEPIHDQELAEFLGALRDETRRRADQAEFLLAQRLANGGVQ
jgi:trans-2-enoyl-CoA reductase